MRIEAFTRYNEMTGDAYVMDYTQATAGKRKVCIKEEDPDDIASFHLINPRKTTYWAVNFEENPAVLKGSDQCECMFVSSRASSKGWVCLVELKYCLEKNIERNAGDAFKQLYETLNKLVELNIVDYKSHRIYLNISIYNPQIQISAESETKRSIFREKDKTKRSKKESAQHSKSRNKSFVMTSVSAL